jgi:hypothetical protein
MGWGTFIAGQTIRIIRRSGKHRYPISRHSGPTFWELWQEVLNKPKLTEQEEIEAQKQKYDLMEQKKLERDKRFQDRLLRKKLELEPEQLERDKENLSYRQEWFLAGEMGRKQRGTLGFKILFVSTVILGAFFVYALIVFVFLI